MNSVATPVDKTRWVAVITTGGKAFMMRSGPPGVITPNERIAMLAAMSTKQNIAFAPDLEKPFRGCLGIVLNFRELQKPFREFKIGETSCMGVYGDTPEQAVDGLLRQMVLTPLAL